MKVSVVPFAHVARWVVVSFALVASSGCATKREPYWAPLISPEDGLIYEVQILPQDYPGRVILCTPVEEYIVSCLAKSEAGYEYVLIELPPA